MCECAGCPGLSSNALCAAHQFGVTTTSICVLACSGERQLKLPVRCPCSNAEKRKQLLGLSRFPLSPLLSLSFMCLHCYASQHVVISLSRCQGLRSLLRSTAACVQLSALRGPSTVAGTVHGSHEHGKPVWGDEQGGVRSQGAACHPSLAPGTPRPQLRSPVSNVGLLPASTQRLGYRGCCTGRRATCWRPSIYSLPLCSPVLAVPEGC